MCINQSIGSVEDSLWTDVLLLEMTFHIYLRFYIHKHDKDVFLINYLTKKNCLSLSDKISRWPIETCLPECTADRCLFVLELIKPRPRTKLLQINWAPRFNQHCWSTISRPNEPLAPGLPLLTLLYIAPVFTRLGGFTTLTHSICLLVVRVCFHCISCHWLYNCWWFR